jgi:hypothetical protein
MVNDTDPGNSNTIKDERVYEVAAERRTAQKIRECIIGQPSKDLRDVTGYDAPPNAVALTAATNDPIATYFA